MCRSVTNVSIIVIVLTMLPAELQAQATPELRQAMRERLEAVWKKDAESWARLTANEFTLVTPEGRLMNKEERLAALKGEKPELSHALRNEEIHVTETLPSIASSMAVNGYSRCGIARSAHAVWSPPK